ncbi:MAG: NADPH dehydrogenase [Bacillus thermozeamaize]|uniref:NADPH dehydrogenase n=1 Tax=Bacillus thermozeamaize TaxID=230954 RepID=A0A1Y3PE87_9BACI|nr:MAG: NADPH dehydrogenase [Bacillus thermozeamaize]
MSLLFQPYQIKDLTLRNRLVMSPMCMYSADEEGRVQDWHLVHYPARAVGGVGLVMLEATAVEPRGRISDQDLGIWSEDHLPGLERLVQLIHQHGAKAGIQLAHSGRKGRLKRDKIVAPSAIAFDASYDVPEALTLEGIAQVVNAFREGARRALEVGMDVVEIHAAHGYLLNQFLSPLSNHREDAYGGSFEGRVRLLREVIRAVREVWPEKKPLFLRVSCEEYAEGGLHIEDHVQIARIAKEEGVDLIDCSSGGLLPVLPSNMGPGYQVPYAERIRREAGIATAAVGLITQAEQAEEILLNGRADLVFLGRELLRNPYWPLQAAKKLGVEVDYWPVQYHRAR